MKTRAWHCTDCLGLVSSWYFFGPKNKPNVWTLTLVLKENVPYFGSIEVLGLIVIGMLRISHKVHTKVLMWRKKGLLGTFWEIRNIQIKTYPQTTVEPIYGSGSGSPLKVLLILLVKLSWKIAPPWCGVCRSYFETSKPRRLLFWHFCRVR